LDLLQVGGEGERQQLSSVLTPSVTNCQVLTILSLQQHGTAEYSRAAILCGLASAMAIEMRLHRAWESDDPIKGEVHSRLWWNLYVLEKMISCEMGRPVLLRREETDCPYPSANEADEFELMSTNVGRGPAQFLNTRIKLRSISGLHTTIRLSFIMERIAREIYGISARKRIREDQSAGEAKRQELWYVLQDWEREMDASPLRLDLSKSLTSVPASVTNYVVRIIASQSVFKTNKYRSCGTVRYCYIGLSLLVGLRIQLPQTPHQARSRSVFRRRIISVSRWSNILIVYLAYLAIWSLAFSRQPARYCITRNIPTLMRSTHRDG
jgi:hypothetical protein